MGFYMCTGTTTLNQGAYRHTQTSHKHRTHTQAHTQVHAHTGTHTRKHIHTIHTNTHAQTGTWRQPIPSAANCWYFGPCAWRSRGSRSIDADSSWIAWQAALCFDCNGGVLEGLCSISATWKAFCFYGCVCGISEGVQLLCKAGMYYCVEIIFEGFYLDKMIK